MSIKTPQLVAILKNGGIPESEINSMSNEEFKNMVVVFGESYGKSFEEIKQKCDTKSATLAAYQSSGGLTSQVYPNIPPEVFINREIMKVKSDNEIMEERNMRSPQQFSKNRQKLVKSLAINEDKRYSDTIHLLSSNLPKQPNGGVRIAVILHNGVRITRNFAREEKTELVYIWAAANDSVIKDQVKLGSFVLIDRLGNEKDPEKTLADVTEQKRELWFLRII